MLEKVTIVAFNDPDYSVSHQVGEPFIALINPENYVLDYAVDFTEGQGAGTTSAQQRFNVKKPDEMSFEFLFDSTGIIDGQPKPDIDDDVQAFKNLLMEYDSDSHEPKHFMLVWGKFIFKGRCSALTITYKLFNPDGSPIRAVCKTTFKGSIDETLRVAMEDALSPDITHYVVAGSGDTLPLLCYRIYGDPKYYFQVAQVNNLTNFRALQQGQELFFPPLTKTTGQ